MFEATIPVTFNGKTKDITFVFHDGNWGSYKPVWDASEADTVWYEKLGFRARGLVYQDKIHLLYADVKLIAHEVLHKFGFNHPNTLLASLQHTVEVSRFGYDAFSGIFRWVDRHGVRPEAERIAAILKAGVA